MKKMYLNLVKQSKIGLLSLTAIFALLIGNIQTNAQVLLTESFDGTTFVPTGWTDVLTSGTATWSRVTTGSTGFPSVTVLPKSGAGEAKFNSYDASTGVRSLMTPVLNFTTIGTKQVSFWMFRDNGYNTSADKIDVLVNTVSNLTGATLLGTVNRANGLAPTVSANGWYKYTFTVPASFNTATNYVFFRGTSAWGNNIYIDDVEITNLYAAAANNCSFDYISNVTLSTINRTSACDTYSLWATPNPTLTQGTTYTLSVTTAGDLEGIRAWIDYNGDGAFNNAVGTELIAGPSFAGTVPATYVVAVTIPGSATPGLTRLRVRCNYGAAPVDATSAQTWGETEDYNVTIAAGLSCVGSPNAGIAAISAASGCAGNPVTVSATGLSTSPGLTFQWQSASASTGPWTNMGGPATTGSPFPTSATATTFYRIVSTCTTSALSATSSVISYQVNSCTGSIVLFDSYGDGWNGATMQLYVNGTLFETFGSTFTAGASQTINFCLPAASTYALVFNNGGAFSSEVGITSLNINGSNVYSVGAGLATVGSTLTTGAACPPSCSGTPNAGTAVISSTAGCAGGVLNLSSTGLSAGAGLAYQWSSASSATGPWTNIIGATAPSYSLTSAVGTTFYRIVSTCTTSATSNTTNVVSFAGTNCISTNVPATGSNTINCGTSTKLYDNGGPTANYSALNSGFTVLNNTGTGIITISGTYSNVESCCDDIYIYSGAGIGGTLLYSYLGSGTMTTFSSTPGQILTVQLVSDGSVQGEGFDMNVIYTNYVAPTPTITIAGTAAICAGATTSLTASGAATYTWTGLGSANPLSVTPSAATIYSVTGSACGVNSAPVTYTVAISASPSITVNSGTICSGSSFTMAPSGGTTYTYTGGSAVVSPTTNATYTVTSANVAGCIGSAVSTVTVNARPVVSLLAGGAICSGASYTMVASGATTYTYSSGSAVVSPTATTTYSVTGTNTLGCVSSNTATTTVTITAGPSLTVNSGAICPGGSFTMTPTGGTTYTYTGGSAVVSPTSNATYTVTSANVAGCIGSAVSTVTVNANPSVSASASNTLICVGNSAVLTASTSAASYTWNTGATTMSISVSPTVTTTYTVNVTDVTTCSSSAVVTVNVSTCTGIDELVANAVTVYPNPNNGIINITLSSELSKNSTLEIYDAIGKLIVTEVLSNELNTLNISNLSNGIYSFRVLNNNNMVKFGKLVKQ